MDLSQLRRSYISEPLNRSDLNDDPFNQFEQWFTQAQKAQVCDPSAMSLATASANGQPSVRTVLLKLFNPEGFVFYTNLESHKAQDIKSNKYVALLFPWLELNRQIKIEGYAEKLPVSQALKYFISRPLESQWAAWASPQSHRISSRQILEEKFFEMKQKYSHGEIPLPSFWGGYRVVPKTIEFWQGRENRLHDRFKYSLNEQQWLIERLAP